MPCVMRKTCVHKQKQSPSLIPVADTHHNIPQPLTPESHQQLKCIQVNAFLHASQLNSIHTIQTS